MIGLTLIPSQVTPHEALNPGPHQKRSEIWKSPWSKDPSAFRDPIAEVLNSDSQRTKQIPI